jgi:hypothetical protein
MSDARYLPCGDIWLVTNVVVDRLSKLIRISATPAHVDAPAVARLFHTHVYRHHGLPLEIISDRDTIFMSNF